MVNFQGAMTIFKIGIPAPTLDRFVTYNAGRLLLQKRENIVAEAIEGRLPGSERAKRPPALLSVHGSVCRDLF